MIIKNVAISRIDITNAQVKRKRDFIAIEAPLHIFLGGVHFVSILCSPALLKELVVGYLIDENLVSSVNEIVSVDFDEENRCFVTLRKTDVDRHATISKPFAQLIVSACSGIGYRSLSELLDTIELKTLPSWQVEAKIVSGCVKRLNALADIFRKTGGVHVAALFKRDGKLVVLAEDVGRHNSVDKVVGAAVLNQQDLNEFFLALSGRLTGNIVLKAARAGIPIVTSLAGAVDSGVEVAENTGVTLAGFVRGKRMNIYAHPERIIV